MILSNNQSRATQWVLETSLIVWLLPLKIILITASLSWNTYNKQSLLVSRIDVWGNKIIIVQIIGHSMRLLSFFNCVRCWTNMTLVRTQVSSVLYYSDSCFQELRRSDPINQMRWYHTTSTLHPKKCFLILLNCAKLKFVSDTSNWLEQTYDVQKCTMFHLM